MSNSVQKLIDDSAMGATQITVVAVCMILNMMDGVDILITSFTASTIADEWNLSNSSLGLLLSSGLFGMGAGALFLAPFADVIGRRTLIIISLTIISCGMLLSSLSQNYMELSALRFVTGIGIGGMIASINTITAEYSSVKQRNFAVSLVQSGNPVGGVLGGLAAVYLVTQFGWRTAFLAAALASFALLPIVLLRLPESLSFLTLVQPKKALQKINAILLKMKHPPIQTLPEKPTTEANKKLALNNLFIPANARNTALLWLAFFSVMFSFYFTMSWTPKLLVQAGMSLSEGISGSIILNLGGIIGAPLLGFFAAKHKLQALIASYAIFTCLLMVLFGFLTQNFIPAIFVAVFLGFFLFGSIVGLYALAPHIYPTQLRSTGIGYAIGIGRIGAVLAPFLAGYLLEAQLSVPILFTIFAVPMLVCSYAQYAIKTLPDA